MKIVTIIYLTLLCVTFSGEIPETFLSNNKRPLCYVAGASDSPNSFPGMLHTTDSKGSACLIISSMCKENEIKREVEKLLKSVSADEISKELTGMVSVYINEMELDPKAASQSAFVGLSLQSFFSKIENILRKEVQHA